MRASAYRPPPTPIEAAMTALQRRTKSQSASSKKSRVQILLKQATDARDLGPTFRRRPHLVWLVLRNSVLHHTIFAAALVGIHLAPGPFLAAIGEFLSFEPSMPAHWTAGGSACAVFVWILAIWISTPHILSLAALHHKDHATVIEPVVAPGSQDEAGPESVGPDGRYLLHREIGRGGMAVVFHATDKVLGRDVALKQLPTPIDSEKELTERFRQEARALASLSHPNVVQVFDLFDHDERLWIAMEYLHGGDLANQMDRRAAFSPWDAFDIVVPSASGLAAAHARGIVHRDVKPMNILIAEDLTPNLTDFGLAKLIENSVHTVAGVAMGSPPYMSPEQAAGKIADKATDMYSLGITLYELLSTRTPFEGDMAQVMAQQITQAPPPLADFCPELAPEICELVAEMLEKEPNRRPSDMNAFIARVEALGTLVKIDDEDSSTLPLTCASPSLETTAELPTFSSVGAAALIRQMPLELPLVICLMGAV